MLIQSQNYLKILTAVILTVTAQSTLMVQKLLQKVGQVWRMVLQPLSPTILFCIQEVLKSQTPVRMQSRLFTMSEHLNSNSCQGAGINHANIQQAMSESFLVPSSLIWIKPAEKEKLEKVASLIRKPTINFELVTVCTRFASGVFHQYCVLPLLHVSFLLTCHPR